MSAYHETIARIMKRSISVGSLNSYETILAGLLKRFPDEFELRAYVTTLENVIRETQPNFVFEDHDPLRRMLRVEA